MPNGQIQVDVDFIAQNEGGVILKGYVPEAATTRSGVTIGMGVDLGQRTPEDLNAMQISQALKDQLTPYLGLQGEDAASFLQANPLQITAADAATLDSAALNPIITAVQTNYDAAQPPVAFADLAAEAQTALVDLAYQYGTGLAKATPHFWGDVTQGNWSKAVAELKNFGDKYPTRRNREAALIQQALNSGTLASGN